MPRCKDNLLESCRMKKRVLELLAQGLNNYSMTREQTSLRLHFFTAARIAQVAQPIWVVLARQLGQSLQQLRNTAWKSFLMLCIVQLSW